MLLSYIYGPCVVKYGSLSNNRRIKLHAVIDCLFLSLRLRRSFVSYFADRAPAETLTNAQRTTEKEIASTPVQTQMGHSAVPVQRATVLVTMAWHVMTSMNAKFKTDSVRKSVKTNLVLINAIVLMDLSTWEIIWLMLSVLILVRPLRRILNCLFSSVKYLSKG